MIIMPTTVNADQDRGLAKKIDVGGKVGVNMASHGGPGANSQYVSTSHSLGFTIGGAAGVRLAEVLTMQAEIVLSDKGANYTMVGAPAGTYSIIYLEIPVLARVALPLPGRVEYYATLGPSLGIRLDADIELPDGESVEIDNSIERFDMGLLLGVGVAVDIASRGKLTIDARYNLGITNIDKTAGPVDDDIMNQAFYFTVGYRANLDDLLHGFRRKAPPPARKAPSTPRTPELDAAPSATPAAEALPASTLAPPVRIESRPHG